MGPKAGLFITLHPGEMELRDVLGSTAVCPSRPPLWETNQELGRGEGVSIPRGPTSPTSVVNVRIFAVVTLPPVLLFTSCFSLR